MQSGDAAADRAVGVEAAVPLCVDLDGSLVRTDLLWESFGAVLRQRPWELWRLPGWLLRGRAPLKQRLAAVTALDVAHLPYRGEVVAYLQDQRARGRTLVLATAADATLARAVADHLGIFDAVIASDGQANLKGARKRTALVDRFGDRGFDYLGDSRSDLAVWAASRAALVVGGSPGFEREVARLAPIGQRFPVEAHRRRAWSRQLRVHQWAKNLLLFLPVVAGHRLGDATAVVAAVLAFVAFCAAASALYLVNDVLDLPSDRAHARKRSRPLASGAVAIPSALAASGLLLGAAGLIAARLPPAFAAWLGLYVVAALTYSLVLKRLLLVDVICLAGLYTVRILAGGAATGIVISDWLLVFAMFFFLGLAMLKRYTELHAVPRARGPAPTRLPGRGYHTGDREMIRSLGTASSCLAALVVGLYVHDPASVALYRHPSWLLMMCPLLLYWSARVWVLAHRGAMHVDPVVFALRDRNSLITGGLCAAILAAASWL